jgi:hypothetical protein
MQIHVTGHYEEKIEIFGIVVGHHKGTIDFKKDVGGATWSQHFGPVTITEAVAGTEATVSVSAFGQHEVIYKTGLTGSKHFKLELDRKNLVEGDAAITS